MSAPIIYRLAIERFRCIKALSWHPAKGVNLILGGGDVGKTTILDAIGLLLSPTNPATLADTDYHAGILKRVFQSKRLFPSRLRAASTSRLNLPGLGTGAAAKP